MSKVTVTFDEQDLLELHAVVIDDDPEGALAFLKRHVAPKIPTRGTAACDSSRRNPYLQKPDA